MGEDARVFKRCPNCGEPLVPGIILNGTVLPVENGEKATVWACPNCWHEEEAIESVVLPEIVESPSGHYVV